MQAESGEVKEHYELGYLEVDTEDYLAVCHTIPILVQEDKALVAVPGPAWSRTAAGRYLPKGTLSKAVLLEVAAVEEDIEGLGGETVKIWMGFLHSEVEASFHPRESDEPGAVGFGEGSNERLPAPEALLSAAAEHFAFQTAQSAPVEPSAKTAAKRKTKVDMEKRVLKLENSLEDIKALLTDLPKQLQQPSRTKTAPSAPSPALPLGLDPGVVAAAQAAGVPEEQIRKIGGLMQRPNRMVEVLGVGAAHPRRNELSETEEEEEAEVQEEKGGATGPVEKAVVQLTKLVSKIAKVKSAKSGLEGILERAESGGAGLEGGAGSSSGGRSKAAAYVKLKEALVKHPAWISQAIEQQMEEDFNIFRSHPGAGSVLTTSRSWVEHRSRLGPYPSTIRAAWLIAGIHDSLKIQDVEQARTRCCLALAAIDQAATDAGSWTLAQEFLLELPPPYSAFGQRKSLDPAEQQSTRLVDDRFLEVMMWRLKDRDSFHEGKKRLNQPNRLRGSNPDSAAPDPGPKPKPAPKPKRQPPAAPRGEEAS